MRTKIIANFNIPHSGNDVANRGYAAFCQSGQVYYDDESPEYQEFVLGLTFFGGAEFVYDNQRFNSAEACIASMQIYGSASHATSPTGDEYDGGRFGPGTYIDASAWGAV